MKELKKEVERAVEKELERISENRGERYASAQEAYGAIVEEADEAGEDFESISASMTSLRYGLRRGDNRNDWEAIKTAAVLGACELIQVAAVAVKARRGYGNDNK